MEMITKPRRDVTQQLNATFGDEIYVVGHEPDDRNGVEENFGHLFSQQAPVSECLCNGQTLKLNCRRSSLFLLDYSV